MSFLNPVVNLLNKSMTQSRAVLVLCAACLATYAASMSGDFVMDDRLVFQDNPYLRSAEFIPHYFTSGVWSNTGMEGVRDAFLYRPMFLLLAWANYQVWDGSAFGFHLTSVFLHTFNAVLVLFLLRRLSGASQDSVACLLGALFFALHPVQSESVGWLAGVTDPLVASFLLSSFLLYLRFAETGKKRDLFASVLIFFGALLSKEVAAVFPFLILAYDLLFRREQRSYWSLTYFLALLLFIPLRNYALGEIGGGLSFSVSGWVTLAQFLVGYLRLLLVPWPIRFYYDPPADGVTGIGSLLIVLIALSGFALWLLRSRNGQTKLMIFGFLWSIGLLLPALALSFNVPPRFAIRVLYLPSIGLALALYPLLRFALDSWRKQTLCAATVLCVAFTFMTAHANRAYEDDEAFFTKAKQTSPAHVGPYFGLGNYYRKTGRPLEAIEAFGQGLEIVKEGDVVNQTAGYSNMGSIYGELGNLEQAHQLFEKVLDLDPNFPEALVGLGNIAWFRGDLLSASGYYERALAVNPSNDVASYNLSLIRQALGNEKQRLQKGKP